MEKLLSSFRMIALTVLVLSTFITGGRLPTGGLHYTQEERAVYTETAKEANGRGMLVLIGGGFDTDEHFAPLVDACVQHVNKETPHMLFIPTAHFDRLEDEEPVPARFAAAGCETDMLFVSKASPEEVREKIAWADIIYETGGNLRFLTDNWKEKGVYEAVKEAFDRGAALIGVSSGAMCWARQGWDDFGDEVVRVIGSFPFIGKAGAFEFRDCANLIPFCVCPHFDNTGWRMFSFEALKLDIPSLAIENGAAAVYENGELRVISDRATPLRTAYLFCPARGIAMLDVKTNGETAAALIGEYANK